MGCQIRSKSCGPHVICQMWHTLDVPDVAHMGWAGERKECGPHLVAGCGPHVICQMWHTLDVPDVAHMGWARCGPENEKSVVHIWLPDAARM